MSTYKWTRDDCVYDIESLRNVFTIAQLYPQQHLMIVSLIDDSHLLPRTVDNTFTTEVQTQIAHHMRDVNPKLKHTQIVLENLGRVPSYAQWQTVADNPYFVDATRPADDYRYSLIGFAHRIGVANQATDVRQGFTSPVSAKGYWPGQLTPTQFNDTLVLNDQTTSEPFTQYYPYKDTDPQYQAQSVNQRPGLWLGYNSTNYDLTMLATWLGKIESAIFNQVYNPAVHIDEAIYNYQLPTAQDNRMVNDYLFSQLKNEMYKYNHPVNNYRGWLIRKAWLNTNRFIDVARLNEHQRKVSLKRLSGMLGLQIKESNQLDDHTDTLNSVDEVAELLAYNATDVLNTKALFEHPIYQDSYQLKTSLLAKYPETVYVKKANTVRTPWCDPMHIQSNRLRSDSSSAQFIAHVIAPYDKLADMPAIDLDYPSVHKLTELKQQGVPNLPDKPFNVLEDTNDWVHGTGRYVGKVKPLGPNAQAEFAKIYRMYKAFEGKNLNNQLSGTQDPKGVQYAINTLTRWNQDVQHMSKYETLPIDVDAHDTMAQYGGNVYYMQVDDTPSTCIANLSYGGLHGQEIKLSDYKQALQRAQAFKKQQAELLAQYGDVQTVYAHRKETYQGTLIKDFFMSKSTCKQPVFKTPKVKSLFKVNPSSGLSQLRKDYTYVSVGSASHEDFSSYYPTLLTMLGVFYDARTGLDPYADLYHERLALKAQLKQLSPGSDKYNQVNLEQNLRKLLLNSASGAGDASFDSNIKMNNKTVSMRIIGQLFAWRIGQAEANHGGRVISSNTDGLYVMDIDSATNNQTLADTVAPMLVSIDPEIIHRFVSKDANNRVEVKLDKHQKAFIGEAKGGTLNSWMGPTPANNLSHPAICDAILAHYLAFYDGNPCDHEFDTHLAHQWWTKLVDQTTDKVHTLQLLQWVIASGVTTHRHVFLQGVDGTYQVLPRTNRFFLTTDATKMTPMIVTKQKTSPAQQRQNKAHGVNPIDGHVSARVQQLVRQYVDETVLDGWSMRQLAPTIQKVTQMPKDQAVTIVNDDLHDVDYAELMQSIDVDAYIAMTKKTFDNSWKN